MAELAELKVRSILVTSGTLSPLESYALELGLSFPNRLENPHIISEHQIHVRVIGRGVSKKLLNSSYERRQDAEYYIELGNTLASLSRIIPGGMLIFFPSYGVMETAIERWGGPCSSRSTNQNSGLSNFFAKRQRQGIGATNSSSRYSFPHQSLSFHEQSDSSTPWKRLLMHKAIVVEPKSSSDLPDAIEEFHKYLNMPKSRGVALFGVCRGKISEGIDFAHDMCRAVIITGLPFAPSFDPKVKMKREFLDQNKTKQNMKASTGGGFGTLEKKAVACLSGHEWYTQQAHRAVNQAVGRVIRNKRDYGAVILMDSRFEQPGNQSGLSKWVRPYILPDEGFGRANHALVQFFKRAREIEEQARLEIMPAPPPPERPTSVSIILQYEDEGKENQKSDDVINEEDYTKIAFIEKSSDACESGDIDSNDQSPGYSPSESYIPPQQIIERIDVSTAEGSKRASRFEGHYKRQDVMSSLSMPSTQESHKSQERKTGTNQVEKSQNPKAIKQTTNPPQSAAKSFFIVARSKMSRDEFDSVKKAVVLMKRYTEQKFHKEFIAALRKVIDIILKYDNFQNKTKASTPELLVSLLQLLPKHFIRNGQECAMDLAFRTTLIRNELKSSFSKEEYLKLHFDFISFLSDLWFGTIDNTSRDDIQQLEKILNPLMKEGRVTSTALAQFQTILPREFQCFFVALVEDIQASVNISHIMADEKACVGEDTIKLEHFRRTGAVRPGQEKGVEVDAIPSDLPSKVTNGIITKSSVENPKNETQAPRNAKNPYMRSNPYAKSQSVRNFEPQVPPENPKRETVHSWTHTEQKKRSLNENIAESFSLKKILKQTSSETFTGIVGSRISHLSSNAPKNLQCTLCNVRMQKPFISECGHMACLGCWKNWLIKSKTCPHCRSPCVDQSIALAIFTDGGK
jgi:hypothetical protein